MKQKFHKNDVVKLLNEYPIFNNKGPDQSISNQIGRLATINYSFYDKFGGIKPTINYYSITFLDSNYSLCWKPDYELQLILKDKKNFMDLRRRYRIREHVKDYTYKWTIEAEIPIEIIPIKEYIVEYRVLGIWWLKEDIGYGESIFGNYDDAVEYIKIRAGKLLYIC